MSDVTREQMIEWLKRGEDNCNSAATYLRSIASHRSLNPAYWRAQGGEDELVAQKNAAMYAAIAARLAEPSAEDVIANDLFAWAEARHPNCDIYLDDLRASVVGLPQNRRCELRIYTDRAVVRFAAPTLPELAEKVRKQDA